jgi:hypothetical protein
VFSLLFLKLLEKIVIPKGSGGNFGDLSPVPLGNEIF